MRISTELILKIVGFQIVSFNFFKVEFSKEDHGKTVSLQKVPFEFKVVLSENPTTGYVWEVFERSDHIRAVGQELLLPKERMAGSAATHVFEFSAERMKEGKLTLRNCRPWDASDSIDTFELYFVGG